VQLARARRGVPGDRLTDEEQGSEKRGNREGDQAPGLECHLVLDVALLLHDVEQTDVVAAGDPLQIIGEPWDVGASVPQPDERIDELAVFAHRRADDLAAVFRGQPGRRLDATVHIGRVGQPRRQHDADDVQRHDRAVEMARHAAGEGVDELLLGRQVHEHRVAHALVVVRDELPRDHGFVRTRWIEHPAGEDDRPLDGAAELFVGEREADARFVDAVDLQGVVDNESGEGGDLREPGDRSPVEFRAVQHDRHGRGEGSITQSFERRGTPTRRGERRDDDAGRERDEQHHDNQRAPATRCL
jgi:hypothetical protein